MAVDGADVKPVVLLQDQLSLLVSNVHPIVLGSFLPVFFGKLVHDPVSTLLGLVPTIAIIQAVYCVCCLPSSGQPAPTKPKPGQKPQPKQKADLGSKLVPAFLSFVLTIFLTAPVLYIAAILFGAPLISHYFHTILLAVHLALLTTPPLFYVHGLDASTWLRIASLRQPVDEVYGMALGAIVGAWLGAIPIPLDWDREWQKWPVTIICGMYAGAVLGKVVGGFFFNGSKVKIS